MVKGADGRGGSAEGEGEEGGERESLLAQRQRLQQLLANFRVLY